MKSYQGLLVERPLFNFYSMSLHGSQAECSAPTLRERYNAAVESAGCFLQTHQRKRKKILFVFEQTQSRACLPTSARARPFLLSATLTRRRSLRGDSKRLRVFEKSEGQRRKSERTSDTIRFSMSSPISRIFSSRYNRAHFGLIASDQVTCQFETI